MQAHLGNAGRDSSSRTHHRTTSQQGSHSEHEPTQLPQGHRTFCHPHHLLLHQLAVPLLRIGIRPAGCCLCKQRLPLPPQLGIGILPLFLCRCRCRCRCRRLGNCLGLLL